jgi:hypothetical protein
VSDDEPFPSGPVSVDSLSVVSVQAAAEIVHDGQTVRAGVSSRIGSGDELVLAGHARRQPAYAVYKSQPLAGFSEPTEMAGRRDRLGKGEPSGGD